jgi:hypothetical protein
VGYVGDITYAFGPYTVVFHVTAAVVPASTVKVGETFEADGIEWRVLYKQSDADVLIITEHSIDAEKVHDSNANWGTDITWANSTLRETLNSAFLTSLSTLSNRVLYTTLYTVNGYQGSTYDTLTGQKVFLLSEEEVFGTRQEGLSIDLEKNVYPTIVLFKDNNARKTIFVDTNRINSTLDTGSLGSQRYALRSPRNYNSSKAEVFLNQGTINSNSVTTATGVRPALRVNLSS